MKEEAVVLKAANLDILEDNLNILSKNLGNLSDNMNSVDTKVNTVTDTVKTLEEEIKNFMYEIRESTIVSNAKESILVAENELEKKYGHYNDVRRKLIGILETTDTVSLRRSTLESLSEQTTISTPNYWLSSSLVALSAWFLDNHVLAEKALKEALNKDDEKTSLLFALIHARAGRDKTAYLWLKRYLDKQDPKSMENKFIIVLDAISNGIFGPAAKTLVISKIEEWIKKDLTEETKQKQLVRWNEKFEDLVVENNTLVFPYIEKYTVDIEKIKKTFNKSTSNEEIYNFLNEIISTETNVKNYYDQIISLLIYNYENEELELKKEIEKNKLIIENKGNVKEALKYFKNSSLIYSEKNDILTIITNIILEESIEVSLETKKLALALSKEMISETFNNYLSKESDNSSTTINIEKWNGSTLDGANENELKNSVKEYVKKKNYEYVNRVKLIDYKVMITTLVGIVLAFILKSNIAFMILTIGLTIAVAAIFVYSSYKKRNDRITRVNKEVEEKQSILQNIICEIVDYNYGILKTKNINEKINILINNLDYKNYININNERDIKVGE